MRLECIAGADAEMRRLFFSYALIIRIVSSLGLYVRGRRQLAGTEHVSRRTSPRNPTVYVRTSGSAFLYPQTPTCDP